MYYSVHQIDKRTWRIEDSFKCHMYLLEGDHKAVLVDTGVGLPGLDTVVKELTQKPLMVINSHGHLDHIGGNRWFDSCYIMKEDRKAAKIHLTSKYREGVIKGLLDEFSLEMKEVIVNELLEIKNAALVLDLDPGRLINLGNRTLEIIPTPGHTTGSICILDRESRYLFTADTVCAQGILLVLEYSESVSTFLNSIETLQSRKDEFDIIWPGHHACPIEKEYLNKYETCTKEIMKDPQKGQEVVTEIGTGRVFVYDNISIAYNPENM